MANFKKGQKIFLIAPKAILIESFSSDSCDFERTISVCVCASLCSLPFSHRYLHCFAEISLAFSLGHLIPLPKHSHNTRTSALFMSKAEKKNQSPKRSEKHFLRSIVVRWQFGHINTHTRLAIFVEICIHKLAVNLLSFLSFLFLLWFWLICAFCVSYEPNM